ncbi:unnamed protein product [Ectocarpus sp. 12 AP-2014]
MPPSPSETFTNSSVPRRNKVYENHTAIALGLANYLLKSKGRAPVRLECFDWPASATTTTTRTNNSSNMILKKHIQIRCCGRDFRWISLTFPGVPSMGIFFRAGTGGVLRG